MSRNNKWAEEAVGLREGQGWRYCYECVSPITGSRMRVPGEAEAYFWYLLGYRVHRMVERTS